MDSKLNGDEINALQSLDTSTPYAGEAYRDSDLPQRLFAFNLLTRQPCGAAVLTKTGERALFRQACLSALAAINSGESFAPSIGVRKWLLSAGFIEKGGAEGGVPIITRRGRLWLASFQEDAACVRPEVTAADFARRRA